MEEGRCLLAVSKVLLERKCRITRERIGKRITAATGRAWLFLVLEILPIWGGCKRKVAETADFDFVELAGAQQTFVND